MSLQFEDNLSDSKMDISDVTTSIESATEISPLGEDDDMNEQQTVNIQNNDNAPILLKDSTNITTTTTKTTTATIETINELECKSSSSTSPPPPSSLSCLDNRIINLELLQLDKETTNKMQKSNISRTITACHPLMSPNGTDSESDQSHHQNYKTNDNFIEHKCNNFPDLIPHKERLKTNSNVVVNVNLSSSSAAITTTPTTDNNVMARNNLNNIRGKPQTTAPTSTTTTTTQPLHNKLTILRANSPDLLSSESDADVSQYHASVEANFQTVTLVPNAQFNATDKRKTKTKCGGDDISSLDSISNHSFEEDDDIEHNLASLSPSSSLIDGLDDDDDDDDDDNDDDYEGPEFFHDDFDDFGGFSTTPIPDRQNAETLPQYTAAEERRDSRNWQKITLPDGRTREIDMRVIEPYKRVLSHGGYLKSGGHNAIVIFCACHLPDRSRADYNYVMDNLFLYVVKTLEQLVTEDYILIYMHGGSNRRNVPPFPWMKRCYQLLDRRLRKSLKNMYLVHPTFWVKSIVWMTRPFVSTKFWRKLIYVKSLDELSKHVLVEKAAIPEKVKQYDAKHK